MTSSVIIIPMRIGSSRFPGKPLAQIAGRTLVDRVLALASRVVGVNQVIVATDDERIAAAVSDLGGTAIFTDPSCRNGSERAFAALSQMDTQPDIIVNFQGDSPLTPPWVVERMIAELTSHPELPVATPAVLLDAQTLQQLYMMKAQGLVSGTTVVFDKSGKALYFSKAIIPHHRSPSTPPKIYKHLGLYGYRREALERYAALGESTLERTEGLEQLRFLENGIPIQVIISDLRGRSLWSIDNPEDILVVENIIATQGELI